MEIVKPSLLIDPQICRDNIAMMAKKAKTANVILRPHFKTHQSRVVGDWNREHGVDHITVSSMDMAEYFKGIYSHITLAIPFNIRELPRLNRLLKIQSMAILVDSVESIVLIEQDLEQKLGIWVEIDTGSNRSGLYPDQIEEIRKVIDMVNAHQLLQLEGLYSHAGHTYKCRGKSDIRQVFEKARKDMVSLRDKLGDGIRINMGDTPGCSVADNFSDLYSISPGNYVFYDIMQEEIGSCDISQVAICLAVPIISKNHERSELVIYGGGIHLSKDRLDQDNGHNFGTAVRITKNGWSLPLEGCYLRSISQEHGIIHVSSEVFNSYKIGDIIGILPVHSCMTADCMGSFTSLDGQPVDHMRQCR